MNPALFATTNHQDAHFTDIQSVRCGFFTCLLLGSFLGLVAAPPSLSGELPDSAFPLGHHTLTETRQVTVLRPGLTHVHVERGHREGRHLWTLSSAPLIDNELAQSTEDCFHSAVIITQETWYQAPGRTLAYRVLHGGNFSTAPDAEQAREALMCRPLLHVSHRAVDTAWDNGPWSLDVLIVDPNLYNGRIIAARGHGRIPTSVLAQQHNAVAAINGGYFIMRPEEGIIGASTGVGTATGISIMQGKWQHEPDNQRPALFIDNSARVRISIGYPSLPLPRLKWSHANPLQVTGINRLPGKIRDGPHSNELIVMTPEVFAQIPPASLADDTLAVSVHKDGHLTRSSNPLHQEDLMLLASGKWKSVLEARIAAGERVAIDLNLPHSPFLNAIGGGPILMFDGKPVFAGDREGFSMTRGTSPTRANSIHNWYNRRNPRTAVGVAKEGRIYFITIDGREYDPPADGRAGSIGASIDEVRTIMQFLGVSDALNLDGGGSTTLVINGQLANHPSDPQGERPVGDVILFLD